MRFSNVCALAASIVTVKAQYKGFNYGSTNVDGSVKDQAHFEQEFTTAQNLAGAPGFTSARLYTMIQGGTTNTPISAIQAAINTQTSLLLGLWASAGQSGVDNEIAALTAAISQYGTAFTNLIVGISVGSEDLYRNSPTGAASNAGPGLNPDALVNYISQVRSAISGTAAASAPVGHVDTWSDWTNGTNSAVINAVDFIGMDAYPYYETGKGNDISNAQNLFVTAYNNVLAVAGGKPIWVTETGWPVSSGISMDQAVASYANSQTYWQTVGCGTLFGKVNTWWFQLDDYPNSPYPTPAFGIVGIAIQTTPLFDLTCPASSKRSIEFSA